MCCLCEDAEGLQVMVHHPVMLEECLDVLDVERGGRFIDATFGGGGHATEILKRSPESAVHALDQDKAALARAAALQSEYADRFCFSAMNFRDIELIEEIDYQGILFDLGVSSFQLDEAVRGFSFRLPAPLDMRMHQEGIAPASDFLANATREDLVRAVRDYGEEPSWRRVVGAIIDARGTGLLDQTDTFAQLVVEALPPARRFSKGIHPATLTFQGIRIAVNGELDALEEALPKAFDKLAVGGVLAVLSYHSLEDRIVKRYFRRLSGRPEHRNDSRSVQDRVKLAEDLFRKPLSPTSEEVKINHRARSAKLRAVRKLKNMS